MIGIKLFFPLFNFFAAAGAYKSVFSCLDTFCGLQESISQVVAIAAAVGVGAIIMMKQDNINFAYSRLLERKADEAIFYSKDKELIEANKSYLEKRQVLLDNFKKTNPSFSEGPLHLLSHPSHSERIKACEEALKAL